jgi:YihY family inner membrane protein
VTAVERLARRLDRLQQRSPAVGFAFSVVKKFGDDRCSALSAQIAYYGFMALFPLLLVLTTVLAFVGNASVGDNIIATSLKQFPVLGQQIGREAPHPLTGNGLGLAVGLAGLLYGSLGLAQAAQHAMAQVWNVRGVVRPGYLPRLARSVLFFTVAGVAMAAGTGLSGMATLTGRGLLWRLVFLVATAGLNVTLYLAVFRILTPADVATDDLILGAVLGGIGYTVLLTAGTALVQHQLRHAQAVYGQFAFVIGLMGWLNLVAQLSLYAAEVNVVRTRHLWPRSILQPPLTDADEHVLRDIARAEERRPEQTVSVGFEPAAAPQPSAEPSADPPPPATG